MDNLVWGERTTNGKVTTMDLTCGDTLIAQFIEDASTKPTSLSMRIDGRDIPLAFSGKKSAEANLPTGQYNAHPNKSSFARSHEIMVDLGKRSLKLINEAKSDWVIEDADEVKLGQFTGANHGVRHVVVEMEPEASLTKPEAAFVAWVARLALEEKMLSTTWILTLTLALITPFIIWFFLI